MHLHNAVVYVLTSADDTLEHGRTNNAAPSAPLTSLL